MSEQSETVNQPEDADAEGHELRNDKQPDPIERQSDESGDDVEGHLLRR
jgi:hypothetical protein